MLEVLKIIADFLAKHFSLGELREASAKKKKTALGAELFFLYTQLNEIYTLGLLIVRDLESARDRLERYVREDRPNDTHFGHDLKYMVDQQYVNILRVARSLRRLGTELQILDADAYASLVPLLHSKMSIISRILSFDYPCGVYRPLLTYCDPEKLTTLLAKAHDSFRGKSGHREFDYMGWEHMLIEADPAVMAEIARRYDAIRERDERRERLYPIDVALDIESIKMDENGHIRVDELPRIREYLDKRKPLEQLEAIKSCLTQLRASLAEHFSISDVLIDVGKAKGADPGSYLW